MSSSARRGPIASPRRTSSFSVNDLRKGARDHDDGVADVLAGHAQDEVGGADVVDGQDMAPVDRQVEALLGHEGDAVFGGRATVVEPAGRRDAHLDAQGLGAVSQEHFGGG